VTVRGPALPAAFLLLWPGVAQPQVPDLSGYYLHAVAGMERSVFSPSGVMDFQRVRLMTRPRWGSVDFNIAYEQTLTLRTDDLALGRGFEGMEAAAPWLDLQGTLVARRRVTWAHGLDRLDISLRVGARTRVTIGRQSISWATNLYFTPTDPFVPFDPTDPFRVSELLGDGRRVEGQLRERSAGEVDGLALADDDEQADPLGHVLAPRRYPLPFPIHVSTSCEATPTLSELDQVYPGVALQ
jgi:hypothetical protein